MLFLTPDILYLGKYQYYGFLFLFLKYPYQKLSIELAIPKRPEAMIKVSLAVMSPTIKRANEIKIIFISPFHFIKANVKVRIII